MTRIFVSALATSAMLAAVGFGATAALALDSKPYDAAAFKAAQAAGRPSVIHVTAPWCPTCGSQDRVIESLAKKPEFADLTVYKVDFDSQKAVMRDFKATSQSTLIAFKGAAETGRLVGETAAAPITAAFAATVAK